MLLLWLLRLCACKNYHILCHTVTFLLCALSLLSIPGPIWRPLHAPSLHFESSNSGTVCTALCLLCAWRWFRSLQLCLPQKKPWSSSFSDTKHCQAWPFNLNLSGFIAFFWLWSLPLLFCLLFLRTSFFLCPLVSSSSSALLSRLIIIICVYWDILLPASVSVCPGVSIL